MKKKILIVGRTGSGKDLTASIFGKRSFTQLKSYATRPKRTKDEDTHIFIKPEEVDQYRDDMIAYTKIGEYEYFATKQQLIDSDIYIIDPKGIEFLLEKCPEFDYLIIYMVVDNGVRIKRAVKRGDSYLKTLHETMKRDKAENQQFSDFERKIETGQYILHQKIYDVEVIENNADYGVLESHVDSIIKKHFRS